MNPTDRLRAATDVALFHARVAHGEGYRCHRLGQHSAAAANYREAASLYRYAAECLAAAADIDGRPQDHTIADNHRVEAARLDTRQGVVLCEAERSACAGLTPRARALMPTNTNRRRPAASKPSDATLRAVGRYVMETHPGEVEYAKEAGMSTSALAMGQYAYNQHDAAGWAELVEHVTGGRAS